MVMIKILMFSQSPDEEWDNQHFGLRTVADMQGNTGCIISHQQAKLFLQKAHVWTATCVIVVWSVVRSLLNNIDNKFLTATMHSTKMWRTVIIFGAWKCWLQRQRRHRVVSFLYSVTVDQNEHPICHEAFRRLHQITKSKLQHIGKSITSGLPAPMPSSRGKHTNRPHRCSEKEEEM